MINDDLSESIQNGNSLSTMPTRITFLTRYRSLISVDLLVEVEDRQSD